MKHIFLLVARARVNGKVIKEEPVAAYIDRDEANRAAADFDLSYATTEREADIVHVVVPVLVVS